MEHAIHKPKTLATGVFLFASFAWLAWIVLDSTLSGRPLVHTPWLNASLLILGAATSICMPVVVAWHLYRAWKTDISDVGISQPQLRGRVHVQWERFTAAKVSSQQGIDLLFPGGKIVVAPGLYTDPDAVTAFVRKKVSECSSPEN